MKLQWSTKTILLATFVVAIACAGISGYQAMVTSSGSSWVGILFQFSYYAPIWLPLVFVAYAIGRRKLTVAMVIALAVSEAASFAYLYWAKNGMWDFIHSFGVLP